MPSRAPNATAILAVLALSSCSPTRASHDAHTRVQLAEQASVDARTEPPAAATDDPRIASVDPVVSAERVHVDESLRYYEFGDAGAGLHDFVLLVVHSDNGGNFIPRDCCNGEVYQLEGAAGHYLVSPMLGPECAVLVPLPQGNARSWRLTRYEPAWSTAQRSQHADASVPFTAPVPPGVHQFATAADVVAYARGRTNARP